MNDRVADDLVATVDAAWNDLLRLDGAATSHIGLGTGNLLGDA